LGRDLVQVTDCFPNLDPGQNTPSECMQGTSTLYTYHLTTHHWQVHRVVYEVLLCDLCSRSDCQALPVHWYGIMRHIALLPDDQELRSSVMSVILLQPVAISTEKSTCWSRHWPTKPNKLHVIPRLPGRVISKRNKAHLT